MPVFLSTLSAIIFPFVSLRPISGYLFLLLLSFFIVAFFNYFDNGFHDLTSVIFAFILPLSFVSPSLSKFFSDILSPSNRPIFLKSFFFFSLLISVPSILQFLHLDFGLFDSGYTSDMLSVKSSGYRFPGFLHMYGALASLVYATYISFSLSACFRCQPSIYVLLVRTISFLLLFLCLLFSGSTDFFAFSFSFAFSISDGLFVFSVFLSFPHLT